MLDTGASVGRVCPQCGTAQTRALPDYSTNDWKIVSCAQCAFVYLANPPAYEALEEDFAWEKTWAEEAGRRMRHRPLVETMDRRTRWRHSILRPSRQDFYRSLFPVGRVLDVGCAGEVSVPEPYVPFGIEISKALHAQVAPLMADRGGEARHGPAADVITSFPDRFFSGVVLRSVLEHEAKPRQLLDETSRVLEPGGKAYVRVPNYGSVNRRVIGRDWCGFRYPEHVNYFTVDSLSAMARAARLSMRLLNPVRLPFDDNINAVLSHAA